MNELQAPMALQIASVASAYQKSTTGLAPKSVTVVLNEDTLVITLHDALSKAERALSRSQVGATQVQEYHRQLFACSSELLRLEIQKITGMDVREAAAEVEPATGAVVHAFATGDVVQVFQLVGNIASESWSVSRPGAP